MTIFPGSLDYLYYNGVLDHIPYEAYEMIQGPNLSMQSGLPPLGSIKQSILGDQGMNNYGMTNNMNNSNYLDTAMKGKMYGYYGSSNDSFVGSNYQQNGAMSSSNQMYGGGYGGGIGGYTSGNPNSYGMGNSYSYGTGNPYSYNMGSANSSGMGNPYFYGAGNDPYAMNGNGTNQYGNPAGGMTPDNGVYNNYDRRMQNGSGNEIRDFVNSQTKDTKSSVLSSSPLLKGLAAAAVIIATPILLFKGFGKSAAGSTKSGFWSKLNPKNWFGGKIDWSKLKPSNWFKGKPGIDWSKLNPANWSSSSSTSKIDWSKLNPKNWFRGKIDWSKLNPKNWSRCKIDWSKLNPKNWSKCKIDWSKLNPKNWFKKKP